MLVAHRGGSKLAPENTLSAFRQALDAWRADVLEMDLHLSADGEVVVIHDETVDRTTDGTGAVRELPWDALRELDAGYRFVALDGSVPFRGRRVGIPRFEEVLETFPRVRLNVESKAPAAAGPLVELVRRHGAAHRVMIAAERERNRAAARGHRPWGASRWQVVGLRYLHFMYTPEADIVQVPERYRGLRVVTPAFVAAAHRVNLPVQVWTVDRPEDMRRLLAWGVDGIQTDRPDVLASVLSQVAGRPAAPGPAATAEPLVVGPDA